MRTGFRRSPTAPAARPAESGFRLTIRPGPGRGRVAARRSPQRPRRRVEAEALGPARPAPGPRSRTWTKRRGATTLFLAARRGGGRLDPGRAGGARGGARARRARRRAALRASLHNGRRGGERGGGPGGAAGSGRRAGGAPPAPRPPTGVAMRRFDAAVGKAAGEVCYSRPRRAPRRAAPRARRTGSIGTRASARQDADASCSERAAALDALSRALRRRARRRRRSSAAPSALSPPRAGAVERRRRGGAPGRARGAARGGDGGGGAPRAWSARGAARSGGAAGREAPSRSRRPLLDACAAMLESAAPGSAARGGAREHVRARAESSPRALSRAPRATRLARPSGAPPGSLRGCRRRRRGGALRVRAAGGGVRGCVVRGGDGARSARRPPAAARTHHYMRTLRGAPADGEGAFATFVFERAMKPRGFAAASAFAPPLLRNTPDEFYDELATCLGAAPVAGWVHQLRAEDFDGAARARSRARARRRRRHRLAERRRFLSLTKLSSPRRRRRERRGRRHRIDAALDLTSIQSASRVGGADERRPTTPRASAGLVEACLDVAEGAGAPGRGTRICSTRSPSSLSALVGVRGVQQSLLETLWQAPRRRRTGSSFRASRLGGGRAFKKARCARRRRARRGGATTTPSRRASGAPFREALTNRRCWAQLEDGASAAARPRRRCGTRWASTS